MENNEILENQWDNVPENIKDKRGTFLLVLCILSWAYIGFAIVSTSITYFSGTEQLEKQMSVTVEVFEQETGNPFLESIKEDAEAVLLDTIKYFKEVQIGTIASLFFGAMSIFLMFSLKKIGFYFYVVYYFYIND